MNFFMKKKLMKFAHITLYKRVYEEINEYTDNCRTLYTCKNIYRYSVIEIQLNINLEEWANYERMAISNIIIKKYL